MSAQYLYYRNEFDYQDPIVLMLRGFFDEQQLNTAHTLWLVDTAISALYRGMLLGQRFDYKIQYRHALGHIFSTDNQNQQTQIAMGRFSNTCTLHYQTPDVFGHQIPAPNIAAAY